MCPYSNSFVRYECLLTHGQNVHFCTIFSDCILSLVTPNLRICIRNLIPLHKKVSDMQNTMMQKLEFSKCGIVPGFCKSGHIWHTTIL